MLKNTCYKGAVAPESLTITIDGTDAQADLSSVSAASIYVDYPGGSKIWSATVTQTAALSCTVTKTFSAGDVDVLGPYTLKVCLTVPAGTRRCEPIVMTVLDY